MTRSTRKRGLQKRRCELFRAELILCRVERHLLDRLEMADWYQADTDARGYSDARSLVLVALVKVLTEVAVIR